MCCVCICARVCCDRDQIAIERDDQPMLSFSNSRFVVAVAAVIDNIWAHIVASDQRHIVTKISPKRIAAFREWFVWMDLLFSSCNKLDEPKRKYRTRCPPKRQFIKNENESKFRV